MLLQTSCRLETSQERFEWVVGRDLLIWSRTESILVMMDLLGSEFAELFGRKVIGLVMDGFDVGRDFGCGTPCDDFVFGMVGVGMVFCGLEQVAW